LTIKTKIRTWLARNLGIYTFSLRESYGYAVRQLNNTVNSGPFKGMKYIGVSNGSAWLPKLAGVYEWKLHPVIRDIIKNDYKQIVVVGCAEGYYAVGLAWCMARAGKQTIVYAIDTDKSALANLRTLADVNAVNNIKVLEGIMDNAWYNNLTGKTVMICDIEGAERELLTMQALPALQYHDVLVEIHDKAKPDGSIKAMLKSMWGDTHQLTSINYEPYPDSVFTNMPLTYQQQILDENRNLGLEWWWLQTKQPHPTK